MIIDIHSHVWEYPEHFDSDFREQMKQAGPGGELDLTVRYEEYAALCREPIRASVVFGGKAKLSGLWVDDKYVAECVAAHSDVRIGFMSLDPTQPGWEDTRGAYQVSSKGAQRLRAAKWPDGERWGSS